MTINWFYVEGKERIGPITTEKLEELYSAGALNDESYIWRKGFEKWTKVKHVEELQKPVSKKNKKEEDAPKDHIDQIIEESIGVADQMPTEDNFDWENLNEDLRVFSIKTGLDRNTSGSIYGPFSLNMLVQLFNENRINGKTFVFAPKLSHWQFLAELPIYEKYFAGETPKIEETERRRSDRRPFTAKLFLHDNSNLYEGVCRDISVGGMQVLIADFPGKVGDVISINVHPENSDHHFTARAKIVRLLEGNQGLSFRFIKLSNNAEMAINKYLDGEET